MAFRRACCVRNKTMFIDVCNRYKINYPQTSFFSRKRNIKNKNTNFQQLIFSDKQQYKEANVFQFIYEVTLLVFEEEQTRPHQEGGGGGYHGDGGVTGFLDDGGGGLVKDVVVLEKFRECEEE